MGPKTLPEFCVNNTGDPMTRDFISGVTILLALFGKDATNVFLSQSVSVLDWVLFAIAPMGVPFAVLAVIRTSQMHFLKSLAGLAEDKPAHVERDLMSSTSSEVSEIWDGKKVVRVIAPSRVSELFFTGFDASQLSYGFFTAHDAKFGARILERKHQWSTDWDWEFQLWEQNLDQQQRLAAAERCYPPNLMLNLGPYRRLPWLWAFTILGLVLQAAVIVMIALATFYPPMRECFQTPPWSLYVFTIGTAILVFGLVVCASAIDKASRDVLWKPTRPNMLVIWLQEGTEEDPTESYVITKRICTEVVSSHRPRGMTPHVPFSPLIILSIAVGYLLQAISLPKLHWPPQALQFLTTMVMFFCRSVLRRQDQPDCTKKINTGSCKDWVAKMCLLDPQRLYGPAMLGGDPDLTWKLSSFEVSGSDSANFRGCRCAQDLLGIRQFLACTSRDNGLHTELARSLAQAISEVSQSPAIDMSAIAGDGIDRWAWDLEVQVDNQAPEPLELTLVKGKAWEATAQELDALVSLLLSGINLKDAKVPKLSTLIIGHSSVDIEMYLRRRQSYSNVGLYQIPPQDPSEGLSITIDKDVLLGINNITEDIREEENQDEVTFKISRVSDQDQLESRSGAKLVRIARVPVGQLYAQHVFICFMWAVGKALAAKGVSLRSDSAIESLLRKVEFTGLGDCDFARLAVAVPLSWYRLLPTPA
ncbi:uncharacterized protein BO97DRAFT_427553 [Aspergillus homomorphus CBS 101889]|uniref:Uncharacterized protein n=1 Tax=Aspergillus homomorphus (strain CBS 101889) TaxID=1450537 RepID=A0A395HPD2_ASPHC|nr:hypothetical protein BO97DRAFT_427553 [Aspergillus homomorphus CBS 101889]RAL09283.1 hypothetical protein BO97DRAFT_427553 [Aspergillus homomorphus CBS 101889]